MSQNDTCTQNGSANGAGNGTLNSAHTKTSQADNGLLYTHRARQKLVRDKTVREIRKNEGKPLYRILKCDEEFVEAALELLVEQAEHARDAETKAELLVRCADLYEVLLSVLEKSGCTESHLHKTQAERINELGGFKRALFLMSVVQKSP